MELTPGRGAGTGPEAFLSVWVWALLKLCFQERPEEGSLCSSSTPAQELLEVGGGSAACCSGARRAALDSDGTHDVPVRSACGVEVQIYTKHLARQEAFILTGGFEVISTTSVYRALSTGQTRHLRLPTAHACR